MCFNFAFASLVFVPFSIAISAVGITISVVTVGIKKFKAIIKKKKKKHDKIVLLGKDKINTIDVLISKVLIDSYITYDEFMSVHKVLKEYNKIIEKIKTFVQYII